MQETFQNWRVTCQIVDAARSCAISQQQFQQNGLRVLAIELQAGPNDTVTGNLVLPFGLLLDAGITLQIDEQPPMAALSFRTCLPAGCVVPIAFDQAILEALRAGATLNLAAKSSASNEDVGLGVSLHGFSAALDRVKVLVEG